MAEAMSCQKQVGRWREYMFFRKELDPRDPSKNVTQIAPLVKDCNSCEFISNCELGQILRINVRRQVASQLKRGNPRGFL